MSVIAHLSDLHLGADPRRQAPLLDGLVAALGGVGERIAALLLTGDVFESADAAPEALQAFGAWLDRVEAACRGPLPIVVLPGNHDRRGAGVFAPWRGELFEGLRAHLARRSNVTVLGTEVPSLSTLVELPGVDADLVAYDSTWVPHGLVGAGGLLRREDLLEIAARLGQRPSDRPLLFALHHHLVPTPITDTVPIDPGRRSRLLRFAVERVLPALVANADREELTMTALGAGTALSTLQLLQRPVLVLHGHKHYPTARLLKGMDVTEGDVLVASAGSCGLASTVAGGARFEEAPRLWPSLNLVHLDGAALRIDTLSWSPRSVGRPPVTRPLVRATREGWRWCLEPARLRADAARGFAPTLEENTSECRLASARGAIDRYDVFVRRRVRAAEGRRVERYVELVTGAPGGVLEPTGSGSGLVGSARRPLPARVPLSLEAWTSYALAGGALAVATPPGIGVEGRAFESVSLLNRSPSRVASLSLDLGPLEAEPFASVTDLGTGREAPLALEREGRVVRARVERCEGRCLLRIAWRLADGRALASQRLAR